MRANDSNKLPPGPLPLALCQAVAAAPEVHDPEPAYLEADGPWEPERVVSMGVEEAERAKFKGGPDCYCNSLVAWSCCDFCSGIRKPLRLTPATNPCESEARRGE